MALSPCGKGDLPSLGFATSLYEADKPSEGRALLQAIIILKRTKTSLQVRGGSA
jgi:hypothetical protein